MIWRQLGVLLVSLGLVGLWLVRSPAEGEARFPMPTTKVYVQECGSCHTAFPPGMLPTRSWQKMMTELDAHFDEDASLEEPHALAILKELETFAADGSYANLRMRRIQNAIAQDATPQRFSSSEYFKHLHDEIPDSIWQRKKVGSPSNCIACHVRANEGRYREMEVQIPAP